jgi:hypothetical protein
VSVIPTTAPLALASHDRTLSLAEIEELITAAQAAPTTTRTEVVTDLDTFADREVEVVVWLPDTAADEALRKLTNAFLPLIHAMARRVNASARTRGMTEEEAVGYLLIEFVDFARNRYEVGQIPNFIQVIGRVLELSLHSRERETGLIQIPRNAGYRFNQLMRKHDGDVNAAYADAKAGQFRPETFMAVLNAIAVTDNSLDTPQVAPGGGASVNLVKAGSAAAFGGKSVDVDCELYRAGYTAEDPADVIAHAALVAFAFSVIEPEIQQALRLKYGFDDLATHNLRVGAGFDRYDADVMRSEDVALCLRMGGVLNVSRPTLDRRITAALRTMREAIEASERGDIFNREIGK